MRKMMSLVTNAGIGGLYVSLWGYAIGTLLLNPETPYLGLTRFLLTFCQGFVSMSVLEALWERDATGKLAIFDMEIVHPFDRVINVFRYFLLSVVVVIPFLLPLEGWTLASVKISDWHRYFLVTCLSIQLPMLMLFWVALLGSSWMQISHDGQQAEGSYEGSASEQQPSSPM